MATMGLIGLVSFFCSYALLQVPMIQGIVFSSEGKPVSGARVLLLTPSREGMTVFATGQTGREGSFSLKNGTETGSTIVLAIHPQVGIGWAQIPARAPDEKVPVRLTPAGKLVGRIAPPLATELKIGSLYPVSLFGPQFGPLKLPADGLPPLTTRSDSSGRFFLCPYPGGCSGVIVAPQVGWQWLVADWSHVRLRLPPLGTVSGLVVRRDNGAPVPGAPVHLSPQQPAGEGDGPVLIVTKTDRRGRFSARMPIGKWFAWMVGSNLPYSVAPVPFKVDPNSSTSLVLKATRPGIVRGWVADQVARVALTLLNVCAKAKFNGSPLVVATGVRQPEGAYEIRVPEGHWTLEVAELGWESAAVEVEVKEGAVLEAPTLFAKRVPAVRLFCVKSDGSPTGALMADAFGNQRVIRAVGALSQVPQGKPHLTFFATPDKREWTTVLLPPGGSVRVQLQPGHRILGRVKDSEDRNVSGALVILLARPPGKAKPIPLDATFTDQRGEFSFCYPAALCARIQVLWEGSEALSDWFWSYQIKTAIEVRIKRRQAKGGG